MAVFGHQRTFRGVGLAVMLLGGTALVWALRGGTAQQQIASGAVTTAQGVAVTTTRASSRSCGGVPQDPAQLLLDPENFRSTNWTAGGSASVAATTVAGPDGASNVTALTLVNAATSQLYSANILQASSTAYTFSIYLWSATGGQQVKISRTNTATWASATVSSVLTLTTVPTRYTLTYTTGAAEVVSSVVIGGESFTPFSPTAGTIYVADGKVEAGSSATPYRFVQQNNQLVRTLGNNTPCVEGPGLLSEPAGTNLLPLSNSLGSWSWTTMQSVSQGDAVCYPAPDGSNQAWHLTPAAGATDAAVYESFAATALGNWSGSLWVAYPNNNTKTRAGKLTVYLQDNVGQFSSLVILPATTWQRFVIPAVNITEAHSVMQLTLGSSFTWPASLGDFCVWSAQVEQGAFPTSYTSGTRAADVHTVPVSGLGPNWCINGVFTPEGGRPWATGVPLLDLGTGLGANSARIRTDTSGYVILDVYDNTATGKTAYTATPPTWGNGTPHRIRACDNAGTLSMEVDGVAVANTTGGTGTGVFTTQPTTLYPGASGAAAGYWSDLCVGTPASCNKTGLTFNQVAAMGDSITEGFPPYRWPLYLDAEPGIPTKSTNWGVSGYKSSDVLTLWTNTVRATKPSHLVLLVGVNDLNFDVTAATAWANIQTVADQARADGDTVHLLTVMPENATSPRQTQMNLLNASIRSYCATNNLSCVDAYVAMGDPNNPTLLNPLYDSGDSLHPNAVGMQKLADLVRAVLP